MAESKATRVLVRTNDGKETETTIQNYDAAQVAEMLNNTSTNVVAIGDMIVQRSYVTGVRVVSDK